jgi:hypothetical protein
MNTSNFSYTEEAFLLNSLHEAVKVWASGNGKADFNLKIENGTAELQLAFRPGHPNAVHFAVHVVPPQPHHDLHREQELPRRRRSKEAAREQQDVRKIVLEQRNIRLVSSLKNQLNQLKFFSLFVEESFL